jgi:GTP-binding protein
VNFTKAEYVASYPKVSSCPVSDKAEFAFIGRSNVGKSSLINMLTGKKALAKVSNTPGKTQMINYFNIEDKWFLVDLPGYGYARVSKDKKATFSKMILNYLEKRENLVTSFVLIDLRLPLQKIDHEFLTWMGEKGLSFSIIYTKSDKLTKAETAKNLERINSALLKDWESLPNHFISSSATNVGKEDILQYIKEILAANHE